MYINDICMYDQFLRRQNKIIKMLFYLIRQCYRSSPTDGDDSSSTAIDPHARKTTISPSVYRHAPLSPKRKTIHRKRRWRPSLFVISEDASTVIAGEKSSNRRRTNVSLGKSVARRMTPFSHREMTLKRAW